MSAALAFVLGLALGFVAGLGVTALVFWLIVSGDRETTGKAVSR